MKHLMEKFSKAHLYMIKLSAGSSVSLVIAGLLVEAAQASAGLAQYPQQQDETNPVTAVLGCLGLLIILAGLILRWTYGSFAPTYQQTVKSHLSLEQVWTEVETIFPKRAPVGQPWARKRAREDPHTLHLSAYPLPYWAGCLAMLLTGILLGAIGWALMGRLEKVVIRPVKTSEGSTIQLGASGYGAVAKAKALEAVLTTA